MGENSYEFELCASLANCSLAADKVSQVGEWFAFELVCTCDEGRHHSLTIALDRRDEAAALFKELDLLIRDVKLKQTTLKRAEQRDAKNTIGLQPVPGNAHSGGSSIGRALGKVLHRRNKSETTPPESPSDSPRGLPLSQFAAAVKKNGWPEELRVGLIGSCTNSSYEDMTHAASLAKRFSLSLLIASCRGI